MRHLYAVCLMLSSGAVQAASIDGAWDCSESFAEGPLKVSSTLIQHTTAQARQHTPKAKCSCIKTIN